MIKRHMLVILVAALAISSANASPIRMRLKHTDAGRGLSTHELLHRMVQRSRARAERRFLSDAASVPVTPGQLDSSSGIPNSEYLAHLAIGTPAQPVQLTLDSGSDLVWTQCLPCVSCFAQALPAFNASLSSTFAGQLSCGSAACQSLPATSCAATGGNSSATSPCGYGYSYGDGSVTLGLLVSDTFSFDSGDGATTAVPDMAFGCGFNNTGIFTSNETGIAGFGRGILSLPSQLKVDNFSYCFTNLTGSTPSTVLLGLPASLYSSADPSAVVQTTPIVQNPAVPSLYHLKLTGITVGSTKLPVPESAFALTSNGTGGTIIDSGTGITSFPTEVYDLVHDAFISQLAASLPVVNSTATPLCFFTSPTTTKPDVPKLVLHFDGATLDLPRENYMFEAEDDSGASATCLAVLAGDDMTIIGNYQQQNMHVLYDLANNMLSFVPARCDMV